MLNDLMLVTATPAVSNLVFILPFLRNKLKHNTANLLPEMSRNGCLCAKVMLTNIEEMPLFISQQRESAAHRAFTTTADPQHLQGKQLQAYHTVLLSLTKWCTNQEKQWSSGVLQHLTPLERWSRGLATPHEANTCLSTVSWPCAWLTLSFPVVVGKVYDHHIGKTLHLAVNSGVATPGPIWA